MKSILAILEQLVLDGYVLHGSPNLVPILEPRQAFNAGLPDGAPAVFATHYPELALAYALINKSAGRRSIGGAIDPIVSINFVTLYVNFFSASPKQLIGQEGFVYILKPTENFVPCTPVQMRIYSKQEPIDVLPVSAEDFPFNIEKQLPEYMVKRKRLEQVPI